MSGSLLVDLEWLGLSSAGFVALAGISQLLPRRCAPGIRPSFAEKLKKAFGDWNYYRVSGDEFIVVYSGENGDEFYQRVKAFDEFIKSDNIPTASIGYSFGITEELENVTTVAEEMMYGRLVTYDGKSFTVDTSKDAKFITYRN